MLEVPARRRHRARGRQVAAVLEYAALGWACCPGAHPLRGGSRACSCDRMGCPAPGAHPLSLAWQIQATDDTAALRRWWADVPQAGVIVPTGRVFDVFEVPAAAGEVALARIARGDLPVGPVAEAGDRALFFVATRGAPEDEDEWWSSDLDVRSSPAGTRHIDGASEAVAGAPGLRWHCRDSYVVAPPSLLPTGREVTWLRAPDAEVPLPDPLVLLEVLADACEETGGAPGGDPGE